MGRRRKPTLFARRGRSRVRFESMSDGHEAPPATPEFNELVPTVYGELKRAAHGILAREYERRTLDTTALVHETYLRLARDPSVGGKGRAYFFGAAARAMRRILVDEARRRNRQARGGGERALSLADFDPAAIEIAPELTSLDEALSRLERDHPRPARVVECRYFGGLSIEETAETLAISPRTVKRDFAFAQAWLFRELGGSG
jgi:RNA polymerase sigma factor (TIGR02999 family)